MPQWNKPLPSDTESPGKTIAGALGVFAVGVAAAVAGYWLAVVTLAAIHDILSVTRPGFPGRYRNLWLSAALLGALSVTALFVALFCAWTGVRWFWVGVGALSRGERVDDDDPDTSPAKPDK